jgi:hypothetical protein
VEGLTLVGGDGGRADGARTVALRWWSAEIFGSLTALEKMNGCQTCENFVRNNVALI